MLTEHDKLRTFLSETREDLNLVVNKIMPELVSEKVLSEDLYEATKSAWKDLQGRFDEVSKKLDQVRIEELQVYGLSGLQLDFKIEAFHFLRRKFIEKLFIKKHRRRFMRRLLKAIDSILGSLSILIPYLHPITEFKDTLDSILP